MKTLNAHAFKDMIASGAHNLENHEKEINTLNVFPVPDGDTGTNMTMTFNNGYKEADSLISNNIGEVSKALSKGLLMGARGNSGVITSQIFRGFAKYAEGKEELLPIEIAEGFVEGARVAYKAIMKPVEGTILTVIREAAWYAHHDFETNPNITIEEYFDTFVKRANESLERTPDLLPALKEANVVDSGGAGLVKILEGFKSYIDGNPIVKKDALVELTNEASDKKEYKGYSVSLKVKLFPEYTKKFDSSIINKRLEAVSDNLKIKEENDVLVVEVNTLKPGEVLNVLQRYGEFANVDINNSLIHDVKKEEKKYGLIAVCAGEGLTKIFKELGVDEIISGGQTMNPSTSDILNKINELDNCKTIFIFPNNSNIILAAEQAKTLANKDVVVIPTKSIQAGLSCIALFDKNSDAKTNEEVLTSHTKEIITAQITYAVKNTSFDGVEVKEGDYLSLVDKKILDSSRDLNDICLKTIDNLHNNKDAELLTIITGEGSDETITNKMSEYIEEKGQFEVEIINGEQPVYSYLFGLE